MNMIWHDAVRNNRARETRGLLKKVRQGQFNDGGVGEHRTAIQRANRCRITMWAKVVKRGESLRSGHTACACNRAATPSAPVVESAPLKRCPTKAVPYGRGVGTAKAVPYESGALRTWSRHR